LRRGTLRPTTQPKRKRRPSSGWKPRTDDRDSGLLKGRQRPLGGLIPAYQRTEDFIEKRAELLHKSGTSRCVATVSYAHLVTVVTPTRPKLFWWILLTICWTSIPAMAQISPGPLSRAHRSIRGLTDCTSCHELSTGQPTFKCLDCHSEIARRIRAAKGLHATYNTKAGSNSGCVSCHSEHNGENFTLTKWDVKTFNHRLAGWGLEGKHAGLVCSQCHSQKFVSAGERGEIKIQDLNRTFLGVSANCTTCHQDRHAGRLGPDCLQCHNYTDWKTLSLVKFDHSGTRYPLTGLHAQVACERCHTPGPDQAGPDQPPLDKQPRYIGLAFGLCTDCHSDPHRGSFPRTCQSCHSTNGWNRIVTPGLNRAFDHAKTKFPLLGKHAEVDCVQCHTKGDFKKALVFQKCSDCHQPDPHRGQFSQRADGSECSYCHNVDGFKPSTFGLKEHGETAYPLQGKHASLQCGQCHFPKGKNAIFKIKFRYCTDCHSDEHEGQFTAAPHFNRCENCHTLRRFVPSSFTLRRHNETGFGLSDGHLAVPCGDCHKPSTIFKPKPVALYRWPNLTCASCHVDPHQGRFEKVMAQGGLDGKPLGCAACHSVMSWSEFSHFDHSKTGFPLNGAHATTKCTGCHQSTKAALAPAAKFKAAPAKCEACHANVHGMQFAKAGVTPCASCHDSTKWKPSLFDHDKQTAFALQGAHRKVRCEACHKSTRTINNLAVLFYRPTPKDCVACHRPDVDKLSFSQN